MFDEWAKAIQESAGLNSGNIYQNYANAGVINASPAQFAGRKAAVQADIDETARRESQAAARAKKDLEAQVEKDRLDPGKAQMIMRADRSGYDFFNGVGEKININEFSLLTGKRPDELLADSDNPRDQKFVSDYNTMKTMANAWVNGDNETLTKFRQSDPEKFNELVTKYKSPQEMVRGFMDYYSDYYGSTTVINTADSPRFSGREPREGDKVYGPGGAISLEDPSGRPLGTTTLEQTLSTLPEARPDPGNWWDRNNPFSGRKDAIRRWEEQNRNNPWAQYYSSLIGQ